jgi:hypothetical protein
VFILVSLKTSPLQVVQGRLFGIGQSKAHPWLHVLVVVLRATLRTLGEAPTRSWTALAHRRPICPGPRPSPPPPPCGPRWDRTAQRAPPRSA